MRIHEYQAKDILSKRGVPVPTGRVATNPQAAGAVFAELRLDKALVKAQVHAGGRGKAGGVRVVQSRTDAEEAARAMLGTTLRTAQTGAQGLPVAKVLVEEALDIPAECYVAVTLDRGLGRPVLIGSAEGGMEIEELAATRPDAILRENGNPHTGIEAFQARKLFVGLGLPREQIRPGTEMFATLARTFIELDASLIELNPLALCADGRIVAADAKMSFDDNALSRHPGLDDLRDASQEDSREAEAKRVGLSYVGMDGNVGCMVNGAGLAMATMDLIKQNGGEVANFLDVGGAATAEKVAAALKIICRDESVRAILVNIFGGIVHCDLIAQGVLAAVGQTGLDVPLVVRLAGTKAEEGRKMLAASDLKIIAAEGFQDAAAKAVEAAK